MINGDGLIDFPADPGCADANDDTETDPALPCDDGIDNDGDGFIDFPEDGDCTSPTDPSESSAPGFDVDWSMDFEGAGCLDGTTGDWCAATAEANADCTAGTSHCPLSGTQSGRLSGARQNFRAFQSVAPVTPSEVGGALTCRFALKADVVPATPMTLWSSSFGNAPAPVRVLMRQNGATLQLFGRTGGNVTTGWVETGFAPDQEWALQIRYRPDVDVIELFWASSTAAFGVAPNAAADGVNPVSVDGQILLGAAGWDYAVDDWACDASTE